MRPVKWLAGNRWLWLVVIAALLGIAGWTIEGAETAPEAPFSRWGYNPMELTGEQDPEPVFKPLPDDYRIEAVVAGLEQPSALAATPDGRILVAEQSGTVRVVKDGTLLDEPFISIPDVFSTQDTGLVGVAVDPAFADNGFVFLVYPAVSPERTVVARARDEDDRGRDLTEIYSWPAPVVQHAGGAIRFGTDDLLYVGFGDHERIFGAQNVLNPLGTIIRIDRNGFPPRDNPFIGPVYAYGLRNPFGMAVDQETGRIYVTENGFFGQDAVVELKAGANYGWPGAELRTPEEEVEGPLLFFHESLGMTGAEFYSTDALPALKGQLLFCHFNDGGLLHAVEFNADGTVAAEVVIAEGCSTGVTTGADGFVYFLDYFEGILYRIAADGDAGP